MRNRLVQFARTQPLERKLALITVTTCVAALRVSCALLFCFQARTFQRSFAGAVNLPDSDCPLSEHPEGKLISNFCLRLTEELARERGLRISGVKEVLRGVENIKEIVAMEQSTAKLCSVIEPLPARELVEDALRIHAAALEHHQIDVRKHFEAVPRVLADRHKVLQILLNILRNAKYAMQESANRPKTLIATIHRPRTGFVTIQITDNGVGIAPENLTRLFSHGFTTKKSGHGFGLHSGANAAREMAGRLTAESDGPGRGASFSLDLPISEPEAIS